MGKLLKTYIMPHPPIMIPEIGKGEERKIKKTINAAENIAEEISILKPETIIILVPPHGPAFSDAMSINTDEILKGNFANFGEHNLSFEFSTDLKLIDLIVKNSARNNLPIAPVDKSAYKRYGIPNYLDHGSLVPLYFINKKYDGFKIIYITYGILSNEQLYHFGRILRESIEESRKNAVFIASGDLSHRLMPGAPAGYDPLGEEFDRRIVDNLKKYDIDAIMYMDRQLIESAGECGYRSIIAAMGTLDVFDAECELLSYEGPFGVGYCVAKFSLKSEKPSMVQRYYALRKAKIQSVRQNEDLYVKLARESLEYYIKKGKKMPVPDNLPSEMKRRAGVFVSLKKHGQLRGCIGTIEGAYSNIAEEIIENAISAGIRDPRFYPVEEDELDDIVYSVDVLGKAEQITSKVELDPKKYGVIVTKGKRTGLLLPDLEGIDTADEQISIALKKAGIREDEDYKLERFEVYRHR